MSTFRTSVAARVALIYVILAGGWILGSDRLVDWLFADNLEQLQQAQTFKGLVFVGIMTGVLFIVVRRMSRLEAKFRQMEAMLAVSEKLEVVGSFAATMAHDLNNMLMVVRGLTELARLDQVNGQALGTERLDEIESAVVRANGLVQQLSAFLRGSDEKQAEVDAALMLRSFEPLLRRAASPQVQFELLAPEELPEVRLAPTALEQALLNLVVNARDAMQGRGKRRITVAAVECELWRHVSVFSGRPRSGRFVRIDVSDTGCGIPPHLAVQVFEPFFTTKAEGQGTGLGLASVLRTMQQHGGWVALDSEVGKGSTFSLFLPAVDAEVDPVAETHAVAVA